MAVVSYGYAITTYVGQNLGAKKYQRIRKGVHSGTYHAASCTYLDGVYFLNPGSPTSPRAGRAGYAYLDLVPAGIVPVLVPLP